MVVAGRVAIKLAVTIENLRLLVYYSFCMGNLLHYVVRVGQKCEYTRR